MAKLGEDKEHKIRLVLIALYGFEALGVRALHAFLKGRGCDVKILFFKDRIMNEMLPLSEEEIETLVDIVAELKPQLVGISLFSALFRDAVKITMNIKKKINIPVIWGGYHPTIVPEECIQVADIVCIGEGEYPLLELYTKMSRGEKYNEILNLWVRDGERVVKNELRPLIQDLDALPFFDYGDEDKYYFNGKVLLQGDPFNEKGSRFQTHYVIQTSRGCPFRCSFCSNSVLRQIMAGKGRYIRQRSVQRVIKELVYACQHFKNIKKITFWDEVFALDKYWVEEFVKEYKEKINLPFKVSLHPNVITSEILTLLTGAGLVDLVVGIQSGSERIRKEVFDRPTSNKKMRRIFAMIRNTGLVPTYDLIVDNPYETEADRDESFKLLLNIPRPYNLRIFSLTHLPCTTLTQRALRDGIISEFEVEGASHKTLTQWRMTLDHCRSKEEIFWNSILILLSKSFIPKSLIKLIYRSVFLRRHPYLVAFLAGIANIVKTSVEGLKMLLSGKLSWSYIKTRWRSAIKVAR